MSIVLQGSTSGSVTLQEPAVAGSTTLNLPAATGTVMVSGNMPTFRATNSSNQGYTTSTFTKVSFQTEVFDTASCFNNTGSTVGGIPAYAFLPNVAGYYYVSLTLNHNWVTASSVTATLIYKNGTLDTTSTLRYGSSVGPWGGLNSNSIIYLNGTTDYIEAYTWSNNGTPTIDTSNNNGSTIFTACLIRGA
jgi:hypothetical protein